MTVDDELTTLLGGPPTERTALAGGSIAHAYRVTKHDGTRFFAKTGGADAAATFAGEAAGLRALAEAQTDLWVPQVIGVGKHWLVLEWVEQESVVDTLCWHGLAAGLVALHRHHRVTSDGTSAPSLTVEEAQGPPQYGFACDNFIGATPQINSPSSMWPVFFRECRLQPQVALARRRGLWPVAWDRCIEKLLTRLGDELPRNPLASLVHGDLWSGNVMFGAGGRPVVFDPATYYGHREVDLAMTQMFGGFDREFERAYFDRWPLTPGYARRFRIYNLYHELNHLNLFGGSYAGMVSSTLRSLGLM